MEMFEISEQLSSFGDFRFMIKGFELRVQGMVTLNPGGIKNQKVDQGIIL